MEYVISAEFSEKMQGDYSALLLEADVVNGPTPAELWDEMEAWGEKMKSEMQLADINRQPGIAATRQAYKRCGKDPNRYRPSHEQLSRRIIRGLGLYSVNALVDAGNLISLKSGCSVGAFDADKIAGDTLTIGIGREGEPYEGIGRGPLNIAGLPVVRDAIGGIGTPTSDNERTKVEPDTQHLVMTIHSFTPEIDLDEVSRLATDILTRYCSATNLRIHRH